MTSEPDAAASLVDHAVLDDQERHWRRTFSRLADFFGPDASQPAADALSRFRDAGVRKVLELGAGQGRDTLLFAAAGVHVTAVDYAPEALEQVSANAKAAGLEGAVQAVRADVREDLPFVDASFDACYSHMLFCMALTTRELEQLSVEVRRVLGPGGLLIYTVRNTADPHYGAGIDRGDNMFESGGFVVHFFDRVLVDRLAEGYELVDVSEFEEGRLPRRLYAVTLRRRGE